MNVLTNKTELRAKTHSNLLSGIDVGGALLAAGLVHDAETAEPQSFGTQKV